MTCFRPKQDKGLQEKVGFKGHRPVVDRRICFTLFFMSQTKEVAVMKFDTRLIAGMLIGAVLGIHYHGSLVTYVPILTILAVVFVLKTIPRS